MKNKYLKILLPLVALVLLVGVYFLVNGEKDEIKLSFPSNPTTGYDWTYYVDNEGIIEIDEEYKSTCKEGMVGCGGTKVFEIEGVKSGEVTLTFKYKRNWEETEYDKVAIYKLKVNSLKNVEIISKSGNYFE